MMSEIIVPVSTEVVVARRRQSSSEYKRRGLDEVDLARPGEIGLILRRENGWPTPPRRRGFLPFFPAIRPPSLSTLL
jgi:hypothetical protein